MTIEVGTLGRLAVSVNGVEQTAITAQPVRATLLVYLAVERSVTRDAAMACIWPDAEPATARHNLSQTLYQLRQDLGDAWLDAAGSYLRVTRDLSVDAVQFTEAVNAARYEDAFVVYRGAFLDGCHLVASAPFESWVDRQRGGLARLHRRARRARIDQLVRSGDHGAALAVARRWTELEPLDDEAHQQLMGLLAATGARGEALRQHADFVRLLSVDDLEPLPETTALADALRRDEVPAPAPPSRPPPPPLPQPLGTPPHARPPAPGAQQSGRPSSPPRARPRWHVLTMAGLAVLAVVATALLRSRPRAARPIRSVAVLPFENLTRDSAQDYFVDGMHEALIADLSRVSDLRVISRTSVLQYRHSTLSIPRIAAALHVDAVIEGSVLKAGDSVRVQASLIAAATDQTLGTVTHEAALRDVLGLLRTVARRIAGELTLATVRTADTAGADRHLVAPAAYEAYLHARHLLHNLPGDDWQTAIGLYHEAIALDSTFAQAHAGLALAEFLEGFFGITPREESWTAARDAAGRALALDDGLADAYTVLGYMALYDDWDWDAAQHMLLRALRLNPNDALARHGYADLLAVEGHVEQSLRQVELGRDADPMSPLVNATVVGHLYFARRFAQVPAEARRLEPLLGGSGAVQSFVASAFWALGRYREAITAYRIAWAHHPLLLAAMAHADTGGNPAALLRAAADYAGTAHAPADRFSPYDVATLYARAGDADAAFDWLNRAFAEHRPTFIHFAVDPAFASLHGDRRFDDLLHRIGLPIR